MIHSYVITKRYYQKVNIKLICQILPYQILFNLWCIYVCVHNSLDTLCFTQSSFRVDENIGIANLTVTLSRRLAIDVLVEFRYTDLSATGESCVLQERLITYQLLSNI